MNTLRTLQLAGSLVPHGETIWDDATVLGRVARSLEGYGASYPAQVRHAYAANRKEGAYNPAVSPTGRIVPEHRPPFHNFPRRDPRYIVEFQEGTSAWPWRVVRASDRVVVDAFSTSTAALTAAIELENRVERARS